MKTYYLRNAPEWAMGAYHFPLKLNIILIITSILSMTTPVPAQSVLFDFDIAPIHSSLPLSLTSGEVTAHFSATGQGYSIQEANVLGFIPQGFSGSVIYPNSIYLSDLLITFSQTLTGFSIMYACQELGCDDAATMRVTAYKSNVWIGTNTMTAANPGTWPVETLSCNFPQGFDSVVVHYDHRPPTCQDYGVIFMADNMQVTPLKTSVRYVRETSSPVSVIPNPVTKEAIVSFTLYQTGEVNVRIYDIAGRAVATLLDESMTAGEYRVTWDVKDISVKDGMYFLVLKGENVTGSCKFIVSK